MTMPDIHYFNGGYEEERHDKVLFGLLGGSHKTHIHFNATADASARDVWEKDTQVLGGLVGRSHDLRVHQEAFRGNGATDIHNHSSSVLGGLVIESNDSDFKTQRLTARGMETRETHEHLSTSVGGMLGQNHKLDDVTTVDDGNGGKMTHEKHESSGSILGGIIADSKDSSEYVDFGQGKIGVHKSEGTVLGGVIYSGGGAEVSGADLPNADRYLQLDSPYDDLPAAAPQIGRSRAEAPAPESRAEEKSSAPAESAGETAAGNLSGDGPMGQAHLETLKNFVDPDTQQAIPQANVLRFDNDDYFLADGKNVRLFDSANHRVNFAQEGDVAVAQANGQDDIVVDPVSHKEVPRVQAKVSSDGQAVDFDFANGMHVSATKNGDFQTRVPKAAAGIK
ncbi:MAG: hypothetical protein JSS83_16505 [Cyanobacteria bacterium SZAS LIN-3]|nr:hypothetical protein [Cyanobacteria bacterium SZAS LIN-3]